MIPGRAADDVERLADTARSLFRLMFRGGSPERIRYSDRLLLGALLGTLLTSVVVLQWFFRVSLLETGLALFTLFTGVYLGAALLSRRIPRVRLRIGVQAEWLLLLAVQLTLIVAIPLLHFLPELRTWLGILAGVALLLGTGNVLVYLRGGGRWRARAWSLASAIVLGAFYTILRRLLEVLFS